MLQLFNMDKGTNIKRHIQKFWNLPLGTRIVNGTTFCHYVLSTAIFCTSLVSFAAITICCFLVGVYCCAY
jgi:hypothetical protein